jgi:hypothetical protein
MNHVNSQAQSCTTGAGYDIIICNGSVQKLKIVS